MKLPVKDHTPIYNFLTAYEAANLSRLHMPGHKGLSRAGWERLPFGLDITEVQGADALYEGEGIIGASEEIAAELYGTKSTCYSAGGSTLSILTMVKAAYRRGGKLLAARNCHIAFVNACILLDWQPVWLCPEYDQSIGLAKMITPAEVVAAMDRDREIKAVYLTSPDYYGREADVRGIAWEVHQRGGILLVDNAHGAHFRFLPEDRHPMTLGADLCCDSAHKTLPVLTGGGYLHSNLDIPKAELKADMALFGSTSPSYLVLASLDLCNVYLAGPAKAELACMAERVRETEQTLQRQGVALLPQKTDPAKLVIDCQVCGYSHKALAQRLRACQIEPEFAGGGKIVLMFSPQTPERDYVRLEKAFQDFSPKPPIPYMAEDSVAGHTSPEPIMTLRQAAFADFEQVSTEEIVGRIAAESKITCPPAVPVVAAGEKLGKNEKKLLENSGIFSLKVVKWK